MPRCSFCNKDDDNRTYVEGDNVHICSECIRVMYDFVIVRGVKNRDDLDALEPVTEEMPKESLVFSADRFHHINIVRVIDAFGIGLQGIGTKPLYILENTQSQEAVGFYGDATIEDAEVINGIDPSLMGKINFWISEAGTQDFNDVTSSDASDSVVFELLTAARNQDTSNFESEFNLPTSLLSSNEIQSQESMSKHVDKVGFLYECRSGLDIQFNLKSKALKINSKNYEDGRDVVSEMLAENSETRSVVLLDLGEENKQWGDEVDENFSDNTSRNNLSDDAMANDSDVGLQRYLRADLEGNFKHCVCYVQKWIHNNDFIVLGAYYGYVGGGEYDGGFFLIENGDFRLLDFSEVEQDENSSIFEELIFECGRMYEEIDGECKLTSYGQDLIEQSVEVDDGSEVVFMDADFDGDSLDEVSHAWAISLRFES